MFKLKQVVLSTNFRFIVFLFLTLLILISSLPYFNIILSPPFTPQLIFLIFLLLYMGTFKFSVKFIFLIAFVFMLFSLLLSLFYEDSIAENSGNYIYFLLLTGFLMSLFEFLRK